MITYFKEENRESKKVFENYLFVSIIHKNNSSFRFNSYNFKFCNNTYYCFWSNCDSNFHWQCFFVNIKSVEENHF